MITSLQDLGGLSALAGKIEASLGDWISPAPKDITIQSVVTSQGSDTGVLNITIPASDDGPHQSTAPGDHRFYRRTLNGTIIMDRTLIRDAFLVPKAAVMQAEVELVGFGSTGADGYRIMNQHLKVVLCNPGPVAVRAPYLIASGRHALNLSTDATRYRAGVASETQGDRAKNFTTTTDEILVPGASTTLAFAELSILQPPSRDRNSDQYVVALGRANQNHIRRLTDPLDLQVTIGGLNAPARQFDLSKTPQELIEMYHSTKS